MGNWKSYCSGITCVWVGVCGCACVRDRERECVCGEQTCESNPPVWKPMSTIDLAPIDLNIYFPCTVSTIALHILSHFEFDRIWLHDKQMGEWNANKQSGCFEIHVMAYLLPCEVWMCHCRWLGRRAVWRMRAVHFGMINIIIDVFSFMIFKQ